MARTPLIAYSGFAERILEKRVYAIGGFRFESVYLGAPQSNFPTIVMLHGGLGSVSHWGRFPQRLAERTQFNVFAYSRLSHGSSDPFESPMTAAFMLHEATATLPALMRLAGITDPILLGHSDGASIALLHGATFPRAQRAIIAIAPHVNVEDKAIQAIQQVRKGWAESPLRQKLSRHHSNVDNVLLAWSRVWLSPEFSTWDICPQLSSILVPLLVIQGEDDEFATDAQVGAIRTSVDAAEVAWVSNCGHEPFRTHLEQTLDAIDSFMAKINSVNHVR